MSLKNDIAEKISALTGIDKIRLVELLEIPPSEEMGDLALPCFYLAKIQKKSPAAIGADLASKIQEDDLIERAEASGPYLNIFLKREKVISDVLFEVLKAKEDYGKSRSGEDHRYRLLLAQYRQTVRHRASALNGCRGGAETNF
jgi:arginyl-tRNA synthetase